MGADSDPGVAPDAYSGPLAVGDGVVDVVLDRCWSKSAACLSECFSCTRPTIVATIATTDAAATAGNIQPCQRRGPRGSCTHPGWSASAMICSARSVPSGA